MSKVETSQIQEANGSAGAFVDLDSRGVGRGLLVVDRNDSSWTATTTQRRAAETGQGHGGVTAPGCRLSWCRCRSRCTSRKALETAAAVAGRGRGRGRGGQQALDETRRGGGATERTGRRRSLVAPCLCRVVLGSMGSCRGGESEAEWWTGLRRPEERGG
jgi:hypothetical protein